MSANNLSLLMEELEQAFPDLPLKCNLSWSEITSLGVGGESGIIAEPTDDIALAELLQFCKRRKIPVFVLGGGSNIVGMQEPFNGIIIKLSQNDFVRVKSGRYHLTVGSGVRLADLVRTAARRGFGGIAPLAAIPGTVGGALRMNAGAHGVTIGQYVVDICGYDYSGQAIAISANNVKWGYRTTSIPANFIITGAILKLPLVDKESEQEVISQEVSMRREHEPKGRSAGCVFKNISAGDQAGRLIDEAGLKDFACGSARISKKHANYIINRKNATEEDIIRLMTEMRKRVANNTGFYLTPEVVFANPAALEQIKQACPAPKVAVLKGGSSSEREVSLNSGAAISNALRNAGYNVTEIDIKSCELNSEITSADVVFLALHGGWGENGDIQHLLEASNIKFIGCDSAASKLVFDKIPSKELMDRENLPTPEWCVITKSNPELPAKMSFPLVVKAPRQGSTVGVFIVHNHEEFEKILPEAFKYDHELLLEKFIKGSELTVSIVNDETLTPIEIVTPNGFYDYDAKYTHKNGETRYLCPPENIPQNIQTKASDLAMKFYKSAGCRDLLRVDFIIDTNGSIYMIEANNLPGFTESSLVPKAFKQTKGSMEMLCAQLVQTALKR